MSNIIAIVADAYPRRLEFPTLIDPMHALFDTKTLRIESYHFAAVNLA
jgi:hypothetical protein